MTKYVNYIDKDDEDVVIVRPTMYDGVVFRSRLEAKWAAFADAMNTAWVYEPEMVDTPAGPYVPDFYYPHFNMYAEVKPRLIELDYRWQWVAYMKQCIMLVFMGAPREALKRNTLGVPVMGFEDGFIRHDHGLPFAAHSGGGGYGVYWKAELYAEELLCNEIAQSERATLDDAIHPIGREPSNKSGAKSIALAASGKPQGYWY